MGSSREKCGCMPVPGTWASCDFTRPVGCEQSTALITFPHVPALEGDDGGLGGRQAYKGDALPTGAFFLKTCPSPEVYQAVSRPKTWSISSLYAESLFWDQPGLLQL
jgi:hypothetical protein